MKNKLFMRMLILALSAAMIAGNCVTAFATETTGTEVTVTSVDTQTTDNTQSEDTSQETDTILPTTEITGECTITENGTYSIKEGATGVVTITAAQVTLVGTEGVTYTDLSINCTTAGTKLTLENVSIAQATENNTIAFTGAGNFLYLKGENIISQTENAIGKAAVRVGADAELTLADAADDEEIGVLYLHKVVQGAGIGGDSGEVNGKITFKSGKFFAKGEKQGALIGTGADAAGTAGDIVINGGELNLIASSKGAAIGGGSGDSNMASGGNVYLNAGKVTVNVDWLGAAIGASAEEKGSLIISGGSLKTYIDTNAAARWGLEEAGVSETAITAVKKNTAGNEVKLFALNTSAFEDADTYTVKVDGNLIYSGSLHRYDYVNSSLPQNEQKEITDVKANWEEKTDEYLYFYLTKSNHTIDVNGVSIACNYNAETDVFEQQSLTTDTTGTGTVEVSDIMADEGDTVTVIATPGEGCYLSQVRLAYEDGTEDVYQQIDKNGYHGGTYTFQMPDDYATVIADFVSIEWDGTIDVNWYEADDADKTYEIQYPAQLAGAAAVVNGLFNNYPVETDAEGQSVPAVNEDGTPVGSDDSYYNVFGTTDSSTVVVGDISKIPALSAEGTTGDNNETTTSTYWYGADDFTGKTICLTADMNMGGTYTGARTEVANWSGPNYMPIGGQYCMIPGNGYTKLSSSFNGTFDGQGHMVYNIYCYRYASDGNYGDNSSVGLIGRMGVHDADPVEMYADVVVRNVAVDGMIYSRRSVGGIVGKSGKANSALVENCLNFATVKNTDAKGCSGIIGAGWNGVEIKNCANFGYIFTSYKNAGGISGSSEAKTSNCYNFGYVGATAETYAQALGTNNGGSTWKNCYYLKGSSMDPDDPAVWGTVDKSTVYEIATAAEMKTADFVTAVNGTDNVWMQSTDTNIASQNLKNALSNVYAYTEALNTYNAIGVPVPRCFTTDTSVLTDITSEGSPDTDYYEGQIFDAGTFKVWANYSDGSRKELTDYSVKYGDNSFASEFGQTDTTVTVYGTYEGQTYSYSWPVTITVNALDYIEIASDPTNVSYTLGEKFNPEGLYVAAVYTNGKREFITDYTLTPDASTELTADVKEIVVSYTYREKTATATVPINVSQSGAPEIIDNVVQIVSLDDLNWFANQVKQGKYYDAKLCRDIDAASIGSWTPIGRVSASGINYYTGVFDGNGKTITYNISDSSAQYNALFAGLAKEGVIKNLTVKGSITDVDGKYTAGVVARVNGGTLQNVTSYVNISSCEGDYAGGIAGYVVPNDDAAVSIIDCVNNGDIYSYGSCAGGIMGAIDEDTLNGTVKNCINNGQVTAYQYAGGIVGAAYASELIIDTCENTGNVYAGCSEKEAYAGGIAGYSESAISDCCSSAEYGVNANDTAENKSYVIGGIVGYVKSAKVTNCYSEGMAVTEAGETSKVTCGSIYGKTNVLFPGLYIIDCSTTVEGAEEMVDSKHVAYVPVDRIAGATRYETSFGIADALKDELGVEKFETIIIASGTNFPDALAGSYLAAVKNAPILMTDGKDYTDLYAYLKENLEEGGMIYLLGGEAAVPATIEKGLVGYNCKRLAGANRFETNLKILEEAGVSDEDILVCTGYNYPDSLSASATGMPILLVDNNKKTLTDEQKAFLKSVKGDIYIIGGTSAVDTSLEEAIKAYGSTERIAGSNRYETSVLIAEEFFENPDAAVVAYAYNFPDGLCGGPLAKSMNAPMILTGVNRTDKNKEITETLETAGASGAAAYIKAAGIGKGTVLGGTAVLTDYTVRTVFSLSADTEIVLK